MKKPRLVMDLKKALPLMDEDGGLTTHAQEVGKQYALAWVKGTRNLTLERQYPELQGYFYDIRSDATLARALTA